MCSRFPDRTYLHISVLIVHTSICWRGRAVWHSTVTDSLFHACLFLLEALQPQVSSNTHTHTHTCPRDMNGICPEVCAKTGGSSILQPGTEGLAGSASQLRAADNISTRVFRPPPSKEGHFSQKVTWPLKGTCVCQVKTIVIGSPSECTCDMMKCCSSPSPWCNVQDSTRLHELQIAGRRTRNYSINIQY